MDIHNQPEKLRSISNSKRNLILTSLSVTSLFEKEAAKRMSKVSALWRLWLSIFCVVTFVIATLQFAWETCHLIERISHCFPAQNEFRFRNLSLKNNEFLRKNNAKFVRILISKFPQAKILEISYQGWFYSIQTIQKWY